jgi:hypothetical protein
MHDPSDNYRGEKCKPDESKAETVPIPPDADGECRIEYNEKNGVFEVFV